ncbi:MAG: LppX_LprAFG lipoprotein [Chloroflexi bacterium]|nr:LppX_LprAFG lipoprotein [Chloroflexota bacterium]
MRSVSLLLVGIGFLLMASCRTPTPEPTPTPTPTPSPVEVASRAGTQMCSINSLHFIIELSGRLTYLDSPPTLALKRAEGDLVRPDRVRGIIRVSSFGVVSEVAIVGLGDEQYITNPLNQQWEKLPPGYGWYFDPTLMFNPEYGIESILRETVWTFGAEEEIDNQAHFRLHGQSSGERLSPLASGLIRPGKVTVDVWVGQQDAYVQRIQIMELESDPENPTRWLIEFSAFDKPVDIQAPPVP